MTLPPSHVQIRSAEVTEAPRLTGLVMRSKACWGYSPQFIELAAAELTVTEEEIADGKVSVAEVDSRPVGVSVLDLGDPAELVALFVDPDVIGHGVGRALLHHALDRAQSAGIASLLIESDPNAEAFYRAQGAEAGGRRRSRTTGRELPLLRLPVSGRARPTATG